VIVAVIRPTAVFRDIDL